MSETSYHPERIEPPWVQRWAQDDCWHPGEGRSGSSPYCLMMPPPNVTGSLHMGHAFGDTLMDALVRFHRMAGFTTLWQPGTDHAGIATQMLVERRLNREGTSSVKLGREAFVDRVWQWKEASEKRITSQMHRLGLSADWSRARFTLDPDLSRAVTEVFVRLFDDGLIYRAQRLVNWDPVLQTAVSDLEVVWSEQEGRLYHIAYPLEDGRGEVVVATTRPETLLGDVAVAVHPEDQRYRALVGLRLRLPLTERLIPILPDAMVDPTFGTGCVKITPGHDFNDYEMGQRHGLPAISILTPDGRLNDAVPSSYQGLNVTEAREQVVADLDALGLLRAVEPHAMRVPRGERSGAVLEPLLTDQWFVRTAPLAAPAIAAVREGRVRLVPENWDKTYFHWMENIQDWCISRQLWWGHRIPAWRTPDGQWLVGRDEEDVRRRHGLADDVALVQDEDVLDTWFSSALWPFSTLGWPHETPELKRFYPTSVLVTGFDILFFWVARMIMMGLYCTGEVPFREVYVTGLILDAQGQKMTKSRGNVLDPLDVVEGIEAEALLAKRTADLMQGSQREAIAAATKKAFPNGIAPHGADALRFALAQAAIPGREVRFDLSRVEAARAFGNKLWNAVRYAMRLEPPLSERKEPMALGIAERWIRAELNGVVAQVREQFAGYRFDLVAQSLYEFTWHRFCDWYLESSKVMLAGSDPALAAGSRATFFFVLEQTLALLHPLMPFVTAELWGELRRHLGLEPMDLSFAAYPEVNPATEDQEAQDAMAWGMAVTGAIRQVRSLYRISPAVRLEAYLQEMSAAESTWLEPLRGIICALARLDRLEELQGEVPAQAVAAAVGTMRIILPMGHLIDMQAETVRLDKQLAALQVEAARIQLRLADGGFRAKAPPAVVAKDEARADELRIQIEELEAHRTRLMQLAS